MAIKNPMKMMELMNKLDVNKVAKLSEKVDLNKAHRHGLLDGRKDP